MYEIIEALRLSYGSEDSKTRLPYIYISDHDRYILDREQCGREREKTGEEKGRKKKDSVTASRQDTYDQATERTHIRRVEGDDKGRARRREGK